MKEIILSQWSGGYLLSEIPNSNFISYAQISTLASIPYGNILNEGGGWLKFKMDNKILIVSKKNVRTNLSWAQLNSGGCVFGTKTITIQGLQYKVRLLTGADQNPVPNYGTSGLQNYYLEGTHNSEWSRLFYPLCYNDPHLPKPPAFANSPYSMSDLDMFNGHYSWTQETTGLQPTWRMNRGAEGPAHAYHFINTHNTGNIDCWRPCLELIS